MTHETIKNFIETFLQKASFTFDSIDIENNANQTVFQIHTSESAQLIGNRGDTIRALNHLVKRSFENKDEVRLGLVSGISPSKLENPDLVATKLIYIFKKNNSLEFGKYYDVDMSLDSYSILLEIGKKRHMLLKKGEIDERRAAISVLEDWHKGKIKL